MLADYHQRGIQMFADYHQRGIFWDGLHAQQHEFLILAHIPSKSSHIFYLIRNV